MNRYAEKYAESTGDHDYLAAIKLFIAEEQRHACDIARFLEQNSIPTINWTLSRIFSIIFNTDSFDLSVINPYN